jgi:hypothetical protein
MVRAGMGLFARAAVVLVLARAAFAAPPAPLGDDGLVALVPPPHIQADGRTPVTLGYVVLDPQGDPIGGLTGTVAVEDQRLEVIEKRPGVYEAGWTPAPTAEARDVRLELELKGKARSLYQHVDRVPVVPALPRGGLTLTVDPPLLVLGKDASASITVHGLSTATQPDLAVLVSAGRIGPWEAGPDGWVARYEPPKENFPQVALLAVVDRAHGNDMAVGTLPLHGNVSFPVRGTPGAELSVAVGSETFGPVTADAAGKARVPIVVPPGVSTGTVRSVLGSDTTETALDLRLPAFDRVALLPSLDAVPADGATGVPVYALVVDPLGRPDPMARVTFSATSGHVSQVAHQGGGMYAATYVPSFQTVAGEATVQVAVDDPTTPQGDAMTLELMPARPESIRVDASPDFLSGAGRATFTVHVAGRLGEGAPGKRLLVRLEGATSDGPVVSLGGGDYQVRMETTGGPVDAILAVAADGSPNRASQLLIVPAADRVTADGTTHVGFLVAVVDRYGYPLPNQDVAFAIQGGGALLDRSAIHTDSAGLGLVVARVGTAPALVTVAGRTSTGLDATGSFLQLPPAAAGIGELPVSGTNERRREHALWKGEVVALRYDGTGLHRLGGRDETLVTAVVPTTRVVQPRERREPSDLPWLRVFGGWSGSLYQYIQAPDEASGTNEELWHDNVYWGSSAPRWAGVQTQGESPSPAAAGGYALDARAFLPRLPHLGAELSLHQVFYGISLSITNGDGTEADAGPYQDAPFDLALVAIPRFVQPAGSSQLAGGLRLGAAYQKALVFLTPQVTQSAETACPEGTFSSSGSDPCATHVDVWGLSIGAEVSAEVPKLRTFAAFSGDLVTSPWNRVEGQGYGTAEARFQLRLGYRVSEPLFVGLQLFNLRRRIDVVANENDGVPAHVPGVVQDQLQSIQLGVGYQR